ncbi:MAG: type IV toxin-antitoxin system AbiEi family antitoxin [Dysgonamonadaceae bacterium]|jgi:predicted transcriptional regulator of viral defense system|nr:type IV toxin-antitoxin system AbiEi family antitoxin [Dysgonamonadaceae bacterium]
MDKIKYIGDWIEYLPKIGQITFSKEDVRRQFPNLTNHNIQNTLNRLAQKRKIQSVWRGFWVIVPVEYGLKGVVDPIEYIEQLMKFLVQNYYIGLLSAAAIHGAAHQLPMELMLVTESNQLRVKIKNDVKISFVAKKKIPANYLQQITAKSGYIPVSTPELTAIDLLLYVKNIGGINRVATVLNELAEVIDFHKIETDFFQYANTADIQRLGYLLEMLGFEEIADTLYQKSCEAHQKFRKYPLCVKRRNDKISDFQINDKWKIIINEEIEIDE